MGRNAMTKEEIRELCQAYGWIEIISKNIYMLSFKREETNERLNIYFTTMTATVQIDENCKTYREVDGMKLEEILC